MEIKFTTEQLEKAKSFDNSKDLCEYAKDNGIDLTESQSEALMEKIHTDNCELCDDDLDNVAGGFLLKEAKGPTKKKGGAVIIII